MSLHGEEDTRGLFPHNRRKNHVEQSERQPFMNWEEMSHQRPICLYPHLRPPESGDEATKSESIPLWQHKQTHILAFVLNNFLSSYENIGYIFAMKRQDVLLNKGLLCLFQVKESTWELSFGSSSFHTSDKKKKNINTPTHNTCFIKYLFIRNLFPKYLPPDIKHRQSSTGKQRPVTQQKSAQT